MSSVTLIDWISPYNYNYQLITPTMVAGLVNTSIIFKYSGPDITTIPCGGLGYDFSSLKNTDFVWNDTVSLYMYVFRPCGVASACAVGDNVERSMVCQLATTATGDLNPANFYSLATYTTDNFYQYTSDGVQQVCLSSSSSSSSSSLSLYSSLLSSSSSSYCYPSLLPTFAVLRSSVMAHTVLLPLCRA